MAGVTITPFIPPLKLCAVLLLLLLVLPGPRGNPNICCCPSSSASCCRGVACDRMSAESIRVDARLEPIPGKLCGPDDAICSPLLRCSSALPGLPLTPLLKIPTGICSCADSNWMPLGEWVGETPDRGDPPCVAPAAPVTLDWTPLGLNPAVSGEIDTAGVDGTAGTAAVPLVAAVPLRVPPMLPYIVLLAAAAAEEPLMAVETAVGAPEGANSLMPEGVTLMARGSALPPA